jgi:hypothetical protein
MTACCATRNMHMDISDTLFASTVCRQGNKMAQDYASSFGWARAYPIKCHETLSSLLFHRDGVPPTMATDDSKEETIGDFRRKLRDAGCLPHVTESYTLDSTGQMLMTGSLMTFWDHCLEHQISCALIWAMIFFCDHWTCPWDPTPAILLSLVGMEFFVFLRNYPVDFFVTAH